MPKTIDSPAVDAAREAWAMIFRLMMENRARFMALAAQEDLSPAQAHALRLLEPDRELPMRELADQLFCDASNVTGIADRLEARGLVERRVAENDRRVKALALTAEGRRVRERVVGHMFEPPEPIKALPAADRRALRDILRRAVG